MKIAEVRKLTPQERFLYWIEEREAIRLCREKGKPKPWTDDEILQQYRFCNVRRMDDTVSRWLLDNWYKPNYDHHNIVLACALGRFINLPSSLEAIGFPYFWDPTRVKDVLHKQTKVFNAAYIVSTNGVSGDKVDIVIDSHIKPLRTLSVPTSSMQEACKVLTSSKGVGTFMAGQIVADLRWACGGQGSWRDRLKWAPIGPGSRRGANRLLGRDIKDSEFGSVLTDVISLCRTCLRRGIVDRLEAIDYQNCLCEFDKFERTLHGEGRPKRKYNGV